MMCESCGEPPQESDAFCGACGALLEAAPPPPSAQPEPIHPEAADDWDEELNDTIAAFRRQQDVTWRLELANGEPVLVISSTLLGRRPAAHPRWPRAQMCRVSDPTRTMSKSHAIFESVDEELWVSDLGSKNGVTVVHTDGSTEIVEPTGRARVEMGAVVSLGDYPIRVGRTQP
ncbi:MAG: FHA domain-containing protein [Microbacteriaceae bacterium]